MPVGVGVGGRVVGGRVVDGGGEGVVVVGAGVVGRVGVGLGHGVADVGLPVGVGAGVDVVGVAEADVGVGQGVGLAGGAAGAPHATTSRPTTVATTAPGRGRIPRGPPRRACARTGHLLGHLHATSGRPGIARRRGQPPRQSDGGQEPAE